MTSINSIKEIKEEIRINRWLESPMKFSNNKKYIKAKNYDVYFIYNNGDYVNDFIKKINELLTNESYQIVNLNEFKDDIIRFIYKYSNV